MGKGKRIKMERGLKEIEKVKKEVASKLFKQKYCLSVVAMIKENAKTGRESQYLQDKFEVALNDLMESHGMEAVEEVMDVITLPALQRTLKEAEERYAKGERSLSYERHGYLMNPEGFSEKRMQGMWRRQIFYATEMGGVPRNHTETFQKKGWHLPYLYSLEYLYWGRYDWWHHILDEVRTIEESGPIPQITWCAEPAIIRNVQSMLSDIVNYGVRHGCTLDDFAEWLLWGFNATDKHPDIPMEVNERWYRTFDMGLLLRYPHDYMTWLLIEWNSKDVIEEREVSAEVPDFIELTKRVELRYSGVNPEETKRMEVYEPEVGCGTTILPYSNFTLFAEGGVQDPLAMKLNKIQMILYAPWYAQNPFRYENPIRDLLSELRRLSPNGGMVLQSEDKTHFVAFDEGDEKEEA
jgi:hypothetical protein